MSSEICSKCWNKDFRCSSLCPWHPESLFNNGYSIRINCCSDGVKCKDCSCVGNLEPYKEGNPDFDAQKRHSGR